MMKEYKLLFRRFITNGNQILKFSFLMNYYSIRFKHLMNGTFYRKIIKDGSLQKRMKYQEDEKLQILLKNFWIFACLIWK